VYKSEQKAPKYGLLRIISQIEDAFVSHVKEQVEDTQIGLKTPLLLVNLVVGKGGKCVVWLRVFGADDVSEIEVVNRGYGGTGVRGYEISTCA
jgi:hypothetical protein